MSTIITIDCTTQTLATQTLFVQKQWNSNDCSGTPLNTQTGGYYNAKINNIGNTSTICAPSNQGDPTVAYVTVMQVIVMSCDVIVMSCDVIVMCRDVV